MKKRILFVDDEVATLQALERMLYSFQTEWEMLFVSDALEALTLLERTPCDVIVADMRMPVMNGADLLARVRNFYPDTVRIALTGHARLTTAMQAINDGQIFQFLLKPCHGDDLVSTIRAALQHQEQEKQKALSGLISVGQAMTSSLGAAALLQRLCQLTTKILECDYSHTLLWQSNEQAYVPVASYGDVSEQWKVTQVRKAPRSAVHHLLAQLKRQDVVQTRSEIVSPGPPAASPPLYDSPVCLYAALRCSGEIIGIHMAGYYGEGRWFTLQQERLARGLAQIASLAVGNGSLMSQLKTANQVKEEILATVSHELRTPLHVIMGYNELLAEQVFGPLTTEQVEVVGRIGESSANLCDLVSAMLDACNIKAGQMSLECAKVRLPVFLHDLEDDIRAVWKKPDVPLQWSTVCHVPSFRTDASKLKAIIKNLISNAMKFTDDGSVNVAIDTNSAGVEIQVVDTGIGIPSEVLPILFEPFRQGDGSMTRRHNGAGLGLYIVKQFVDLLGGTISIDSQPEQGTCVRVLLPAVDGPSEAPQSLLIESQ